METWEYLYQFGKPITESQLIYRKINGDKSLGATRKVITEKEYVAKYRPIFLKKMEIAKRAGKEFEGLPCIKAMLVTGSVASEYPSEGDDVDIMFICKKDTIWLCRLFVYISSLVKGFKIRRDAIRVKDRLCLNLWIEEDFILPKNKQNLRNAMDAILAKVVFGKETYNDFLHNNKWIDSYVSFGYTKIKIGVKKETVMTTNKLVAILNLVIYCGMRLYMKKKGREAVDLHKAFFHP